jgi:hypothetical protein
MYIYADFSCILSGENKGENWPIAGKEVTLIKNKIKFSSYIRTFRWDRLQSHIWLTASSYLVKYLLIFSYIRKTFLIYDIALIPSEFPCIRGKFDFSFLTVQNKILM